MANIPMYSAMKKVAYLKPEYSVMWPATISDSPSGTSNGVRFDSTRPDTKNKMNKLVSTRGHYVFIYQHFDAVSHWLQKPEWSNAVRAIAILYPAENFSLQHRHHREQRQKYSE